MGPQNDKEMNLITAFSVHSTSIFEPHLYICNHHNLMFATDNAFADMKCIALCRRQRCVAYTVNITSIHRVE